VHAKDRQTDTDRHATIMQQNNKLIPCHFVWKKPMRNYVTEICIVLRCNRI